MTDKKIEETSTVEVITATQEPVPAPKKVVKKPVKKVARKENKIIGPDHSPLQPIGAIKGVEGPPRVPPVTKTVSDHMWDGIKNMEISMFGLPMQKVSEVFERVNVEPSKVYLTTKVSSALPALESVLGNGYDLEVAYKYIVVSKK